MDMGLKSLSKSSKQRKFTKNFIARSKQFAEDSLQSWQRARYPIPQLDY